MPSVVIVGIISDPVGAVKSPESLSRATGLGSRVHFLLFKRGINPQAERKVKKWPRTEQHEAVRDPAADPNESL
nr:MAG TPA: hypothetical protein [Bacteriophage sp.]